MQNHIDDAGQGVDAGTRPQLQRLLQVAGEAQLPRLTAIDPEQRPVTWNRVLLLLGAPIVRRGRWGRP